MPDIHFHVHLTASTGPGRAFRTRHSVNDRQSSLMCMRVHGNCPTSVSPLHLPIHRLSDRLPVSRPALFQWALRPLRLAPDTVTTVVNFSHDALTAASWSNWCRTLHVRKVSLDNKTYRDRPLGSSERPANNNSNKHTALNSNSCNYRRRPVGPSIDSTADRTQAARSTVKTNASCSRSIMAPPSDTYHGSNKG